MINNTFVALLSVQLAAAAGRHLRITMPHNSASKGDHLVGVRAFGSGR